MIIAEVSSRIESIKEWVKLLRRLGLTPLKILESDKNYFSLFILRKERAAKPGDLAKYKSVLKPCIYKRR